MIDYAIDGFTHEEVMNELLFKNGSRKSGFICKLLDKNNQPKRELNLLPGGSINLDSNSEITRTATFSVIEKNDDIDWLSDRVQFFFCLEMPDGSVVKWSLGIFIITSPQETISIDSSISGGERNVEAYDLTLILREDKLMLRRMYPAGTPYLEIINDLIAETGINAIHIEDNGALLLNDREYDAGTSRLEIINLLLNEINFTKLYCDTNGYFRARKHISPTRQAIGHRFEVNNNSVIAPQFSIEKDSFSLPNVFVAVVSNPETGEMMSEAINDSPSSKISTVQRGRNIVLFETIDNIANQAELDGYVERKKEETSQIYETTNMRTAIMPLHGFREIIEIAGIEETSIRYEEVGWSIPLSVGDMMGHTVRRIVYL